MTSCPEAEQETSYVDETPTDSRNPIRNRSSRAYRLSKWGLLSAIIEDPQSHWMLSIPAIDTLQRIWKQDYLPQDLGGSWIADDNRLEAAKLFYSPYDLDASAAKKRSTYWIGYKVHFTETCDEDLPRLITHVAADIGPIPDREALPDIHAALQQEDLLPEQHLVTTPHA